MHVKLIGLADVSWDAADAVGEIRGIHGLPVALLIVVLEAALRLALFLLLLKQVVGVGVLVPHGLRLWLRVSLADATLVQTRSLFVIFL